MSLSRAEITKIVRELADGYQGTATPQRINEGLCSDFAQDLDHVLREHGEYGALQIDDEGQENWDEGDAWVNLGWLARSGRWDDRPKHYWVFLNGLHFDAECPQGTEDWLELPFFRRWRSSPWSPVRKHDPETERVLLVKASEIVAFSRRKTMEYSRARRAGEVA